MANSAVIESLIAERERNYTGDEGNFNTVAELIALRQAGYLLGADAEYTARDWTGDESADIKHAYRCGHHRELLREMFSGECDEVDCEDSETSAELGTNPDDCTPVQDIPR